ncbi:hypothetical protein CYMTET_29851 [Cymbomonas tetramitiformis]|uniref:Uncharacterized protein n=1 Tax=Cymbomonas tetramitiformis TaxID=36881 RepID=A0AAE0FK75_9CHLO|nr:hypothetical protein CYMTET_29851 [Cymbomonas tetramitiformis]
MLPPITLPVQHPPLKRSANDKTPLEQNIQDPELLAKSLSNSLNNIREGTEVRMRFVQDSLRPMARADMSSELDAELEAMLWMRLGAPPVYYQDDEGEMRPDPYAPSRLFPPPSGFNNYTEPPQTPNAWTTENIQGNRDRRQKIMEERRARMCDLKAETSLGQIPSSVEKDVTATSGKLPPIGSSTLPGTPRKKNRGKK